MLESTEVIVKDEDVLKYVNKNRGILWDRIALFKDQLRSVAGAIEHKAGDPQSDEMKEVFPLKQTLEGGLYTRELFMPKGSVVVSMIHRQQHPSFLLSGRVSYLNDEGEIITISGPHVIFTQTGTQRVLYIHEDTNWCCVYKTDAKTFEEAEADVYTDDYRDLPDTIIIQKKELCLE